MFFAGTKIDFFALIVILFFGKYPKYNGENRQKVQRWGLFAEIYIYIVHCSG